MAGKGKNSKLKKQIRDTFILTVIICAVIYIAYVIISLISSPTDTFILQKSTIYEEESKVGYVIRDEHVIESNTSDESIETIKSDGEKVAQGNPIFKYYNVNEEKLNKQIDELNVKIQEALLGNKNIPSSDIKALESQMETQLEKLKNENNMQNISEYKNNISNTVVKKAKIAGSLSAAGQYINDLISQRNELEQTLTNGAQYVYSDSSGVVSYRIDGLEDKLTVANLENITSEELNKLNLTTGQIVSKTDNKAKIIKNFECYIAVSSHSDMAKKAEKGKSVTLRLSNKEEIKAEIYSVKQEGNKTLIIFKINDGVEKLISYRKISLDIIWWKYSGLRVPKSAIMYENGLSYIIRKKQGNLEKVFVKILKENDNFCIIDNYDSEDLIELGYTTDEIESMKTIKLYDEIIVDPELK